MVDTKIFSAPRFKGVKAFRNFHFSPDSQLYASIIVVNVIVLIIDYTGESEGRAPPLVTNAFKSLLSNG